MEVWDWGNTVINIDFLRMKSFDILSLSVLTFRKGFCIYITINLLGDEFATPPEGRTPEAENSSETQPTQQPALSPDSPLDVFKPVFGDP